MSKQDGYASRTAADLERKYKFGQTFGEVYNLISDARKAAEEAKQSVTDLDQEAIFNLLTNFGEDQGVYRGDDGKLYINANIIKSGTLSGTDLKVDAANIHGKLIATQVDIKDLEVNAAKVTGKMVAGRVDITDLTVSAAKITGVLSVDHIDSDNLYIKAVNITGKLTANQIDASKLEVSAANIKGTLGIGQIDEEDFDEGVVAVIKGTVDADFIEAIGITATELTSEGTHTYQTISISDGVIDFYNGYIATENYGELTMSSGDLNFIAQGCTSRGGTVRFYLPGGYWELDEEGWHFN